MRRPAVVVVVITVYYICVCVYNTRRVTLTVLQKSRVARNQFFLLIRARALSKKTTIDYVRKQT